MAIPCNILAAAPGQYVYRGIHDDTKIDFFQTPGGETRCFFTGTVEGR